MSRTKMEKAAIGPELMDIDTVASLLSISPFTLRRHIYLENVIPTRIGRRVLVSRESVEKVKVNGLPALRSKPIADGD